jgi:hypothetical protein
VKIPTILAYDDLDRTEKDQRTPATATHYVGLDGRWAELDLTPEHEGELLAFIGRYMKAGITPAEPPKPPKGGGPPGAERNQRILEFAQQRGLKHTKRSAGGWYFPVATMAAWEKYEKDLEEARGVGSDRPGRDAGDRG